MGVAIPETIKVLLEQDDLLSKKFDTLKDGKKRAIIHQINRIKNVDLQIERAQKTDLDHIFDRNAAFIPKSLYLKILDNC